MISCTDFIPVYSELFCYLEEHYGRGEIDNYWHAMFKPGGGSPLVNFVQREGIKGCFAFCSEEDEKLLLWVSIGHSHLSKN